MSLLSVNFAHILPTHVPWAVEAFNKNIVTGIELFSGWIELHSASNRVQESAQFGQPCSVQRSELMAFTIMHS